VSTGFCLHETPEFSGFGADANGTKERSEMQLNVASHDKSVRFRYVAEPVRFRNCPDTFHAFLTQNPGGA